jgi:hypothetical protein
MELDKIKENALQAIDNVLQLEHNPLFTQNTDLLASEKQNWTSCYTSIRRNPSKYLIRTNASEAESDDDRDEDEVTIPDDNFQRALSIMVDVRAYFQVTYKVMFLQSRAARG